MTRIALLAVAVVAAAAAAGGVIVLRHGSARPAAAAQDVAATPDPPKHATAADALKGLGVAADPQSPAASYPDADGRPYRVFVGKL